MIVRPVADIASFPAPGWTASPLFEKVNSVDPDDSTFLTGLAPGAQDPQIALQLGDLEIPFGASGRLTVKVRLAWDRALTVIPDAVRIGLAPVASLGGDDPALTFVRSITGFSSTQFEEIEVNFDYTDWAGDSSLFGIYLEMTPNATDAGAIGLWSWCEVESCIPAVVVDRCSLGSLTPAEMIREARDWHPTFEQRAHPNATLLRAISSFEREVAGTVAKTNPALLASNLSVVLPLATFAEGITLPSVIYVLPGITLINTNDASLGREVPLVNMTMRHRPQDYNDLVVFLQGKQLFLGGIEEWWTGFNSIRISAVLTPPTVMTLDTPLQLPDYAHDAYVGKLVEIMGMRQGLLDLVTLGREMQALVIQTIVQQKSAEAFITIDAFPGGW